MKADIRTIKIITAALLTFIVLLLTALLLNAVLLIRSNAQRTRLENQLAQATAQATLNQQEIEHRLSDEYIERYARELLNMKRRGESVFIVE